jgi:hypothetical protein
MKTFFIDTGLLLATVATLPANDLLHYVFLTLTAIKYTIDIFNWVEKRFSKKAKPSPDEKTNLN